jgi:hypothetical protein
MDDSFPNDAAILTHIDPMGIVQEKGLSIGVRLGRS